MRKSTFSMTEMPKLDGMDSHQKRIEIREYFNLVYDRYESLFELLANDKSYYQIADRLRHPLIFYYGHTASFFINKLKLAKAIDERVDPRLESIFAIGVDEMSWDDLNEQSYEWPSVEETRLYRDRVRKVVNHLIDTMPLTLPIKDDSICWVILMGIEHENIHIETSSVLIRQLPISSLLKSRLWSLSTDMGNAPTNQLIEVASSHISIGKAKSSKLYGWDNEYGRHQANIPAFKASKYLVSNGEFLPFVEDGGYLKDHFWSDEGLAWRKYSEAIYPTFWLLKDGQYYMRTMTDEITLPLNWPVEVNYHEAEAFCTWLSEKSGKNITLPTEDEYIALRDYSGIKDIVRTEANIGLKVAASSVAVDRFVHGEFCDVVGNVWQWSRTPIYPFDGFEVHPVYDDFTVPTFDGKHNLMKGGSWASCGNVASLESRYAFRRHFFQHAGFRYVQSNYQEEIETNSYESDTLISQYCHFGWGDEYFDVANYPAKCASIAIEMMGDRKMGRALDLGCAIGRSSFELARSFEQVIGIDFSARFIQYAQKIKDNGLLRYKIPIEGELYDYCEVRLNDFDLDDTVDRVEFWQGDACNLKSTYKGFDLIFAGNLLDRLYDPQRFLDSISHRLNSGGVFILTSPYSWQEDFTPKEKWIGGFKRGGENLTTFDGLREILEVDFKLKELRDVPFVIRETGRKFQHTVAQMSIWELKS